jgi:hypothetical protein
MQYQQYDCEQIGAEINRIRVRVSQLGGRLDEAASNDKAIVGVGLILFWPALFAVGGTKQQEAEYARLKGEYEALEQAAIQKKCVSGAAGGPSAATSATPTVAAASSPAIAAPAGSSSAQASPALNLRPTSGGLENAVAPGQIADRVIAVGSRVIELGDSTWVLVSRQEGVAQGMYSTAATGSTVTGPMLQGVAAEVRSGRIHRVVAMEAPTSPVRGAIRWPNEPCRISSVIFKETFRSGFDRPECLYVRRINLEDEVSTMAAVIRWSQRNKIELAESYYEVAYERYVVEEFVRTRVYLPVEAVKFDGAAIAWAQNWANGVRPLADRKGTRAFLAPIQ